MRRRTLHRRTVLRGAAGVAIALPLLEIMLDGRGGHSAQAATPRRRYVFTFGGLSSGAPEVIVPGAAGFNYEITRPLRPLGDLGLANEVSVVSGLHLPQQGPGGWSGRWHSSSIGPLISGVSATGETAPGNPLGHGTPVARGPTSDQIVAEAIGMDTSLRSLELRVQPEVYRENDATFGVLSYRRTNTGAIQANEPFASPRLAYDSLFAGFAPGDPADAEVRARELARNRSMLDLVGGRGERLLNRLGRADRERVQRHFDEIRDLERRLTEVLDPTSGACLLPEDPGEDDPVTTVQQGEFDGIPRFLGWANEERRAQVMTDIMHMALTCELTSVGTLAYTFAQCFIDTAEMLGIQRTDVHELGHGGGDDNDHADAVAWHVRHFGRLVQKLRDTPEADGSLLDSTVLVFMPEGGWAGGDPHTGENMVALIAGGRAGGLQPGQHVPGEGRHPACLLVSAMQAAGVNADALGEVEGNIPELFEA